MAAGSRMISLDAMRGFTIAAMILVNTPGSWSHIYPPLAHKVWNGITPTDLIFPFFIFIVGISIALAYGKRVASGLPVNDLYRKILWRSIKIFAVGIFLNLYPYFNFAELRFAGVLQRIAIVFFVCAFLFLKLDQKKLAITGALLLWAYWLAMTIIPTHGYNKAMLEPGVNLAAWFDSKFLPGKLWAGTWDPEGLLSTLPAIATGITGLLAGTLLRSDRTRAQKIIWLFTAGFIASVLGTIWSWQFPLNKNLWTSSYVLVSSGLAATTLATLMVFIDEMGYERFARPFVIFGSNAIAVYVLAGMADFLFWGINIGEMGIKGHFMEILISAGLAANFASMLYALIYTALLFVPAFVLFKRGIFIKL
ncbi:MAG: DUF1624 domain-containing protein [Bacteroidetes bacterium]|nr:DUF1624 domain-containing protein [Bacteroidota bacterium]